MIFLKATKKTFSLVKKNSHFKQFLDDFLKKLLQT